MLTLIPGCFNGKWQVSTILGRIDLASLGGTLGRGNIKYNGFLPILRWIGYGNYENKMEKTA